MYLGVLGVVDSCVGDMKVSLHPFALLHLDMHPSMWSHKALLSSRSNQTNNLLSGELVACGEGLADHLVVLVSLPGLHHIQDHLKVTQRTLDEELLGVFENGPSIVVATIAWLTKDSTLLQHMQRIQGGRVGSQVDRLEVDLGLNVNARGYKTLRYCLVGYSWGDSCRRHGCLLGV